MIRPMHWEQWTIALSLAGALAFSLRAVLVRRGRWQVAIPAAILFLVAGYELVASHWEKTVSAPIRLDMFLEVPLMIVCLIWGAIGVALSLQKRTT
jgi:hypothetical protein